MAGDENPSELIDAKIAGMGDWRGTTLARLRALIREADPEVVEEVKWRKPGNPSGVPVWEHAGIICTGETYKDKVKLTFAYGAALDDPAGLARAFAGAEAVFAMPIRSVLWITWRCRLEASTTSSSTRPIVPTPAAAR